VEEHYAHQTSDSRFRNCFAITAVVSAQRFGEPLESPVVSRASGLGQQTKRAKRRPFVYRLARANMPKMPQPSRSNVDDSGDCRNCAEIGDDQSDPIASTTIVGAGAQKRTGRERIDTCRSTFGESRASMAGDTKSYKTSSRSRRVPDELRYKGICTGKGNCMTGGRQSRRSDCKHYVFGGNQVKAGKRVIRTGRYRPWRLPTSRKFFPVGLQADSHLSTNTGLGVSPGPFLNKKGDSGLGEGCL
jgi:hypothetical protein